MDNLFIKPIDPDADPVLMGLDLNWYTQPKLKGFSFMIRAKNEAKNLATCLLSLIKWIPKSVPYELVIIDNQSSDYTELIAETIVKSQVPEIGRVVKYPFRLSKPGLENYYAPVDSVHSFVYFTQYCMMKCRHEWIFRWDADFEMTESVGRWLLSFWEDHLLKKNYNSRQFDYVMIPATDQDGIVNSEMYLFNTLSAPYFYRHSIWEQVNFLKIIGSPFLFLAKREDALILHQSTLKIIKSSYLEEPWWQSKIKQYENDSNSYSHDYIVILKEIESKCQKFIEQLPPNAQTFCRSMDPKPVEVTRWLPQTKGYFSFQSQLENLVKN